MVNLEVGKRYMTSLCSPVRCVYMDIRAACPWYLMVIEKTNQTFWSNVHGEGEDDITIVKEIAQRKTKTVFLNVYDSKTDGLCAGDTTPSLDAARAANAGGRVGVVKVELVNNIETGEVEG